MMQINQRFEVVWARTDAWPGQRPGMIRSLPRHAPLATFHTAPGHGYTYGYIIDNACDAVEALLAVDAWQGSEASCPACDLESTHADDCPFGRVAALVKRLSDAGAIAPEGFIS